MRNAPRNLLSAARITAEKPGDKPRKLSDGGGLFLLVQPNGARGWRFKYQGPNGERLLSLGTYPDTGLALARERADEARQLLARGLDPSELRKARKADKTAARQAKAAADERETLLAAGEAIPGSFRALVEEWQRVRGANWSPAYRVKVEALFRLHLLPCLGNLPVAEVTAPRLLEALRNILADD